MLRDYISLEFKPASFKRLPEEDYTGDVTLNLVSGNLAAFEFQRTPVYNQFCLKFIKG